MMKKNFYETLGVSQDAPPEQIRAAYRNLSKQYHPDKNQGNKEAEEKFKEIAEAYAVLSDQKARERYDLTGGTKELHIDQEFLSFIRVSIPIIMEQVDIDVADLSEELRKANKKHLALVENSIKSMEKELAKYENVNRRMKHKNGDNLIGSVLTTKIKEFKLNLISANDQLEVVAEIGIILKDYQYEYDKRLEEPFSRRMKFRGSFLMDDFPFPPGMMGHVEGNE